MFPLLMFLSEMKKTFISLFLSIFILPAVEASDSLPALPPSDAAKVAPPTPVVVHSAVGDKSSGSEGRLLLTNIGKKQQYNGSMKESWDTDIMSPKSVTFSADGTKFYVNSLEGCKTVSYRLSTLKKLAVIPYSFTAADSFRTAPLSGFYPFKHYPAGEKRAFSGKPVESTWSHNGRYLWVPFYRRTFDLNAQDPSAIAVVDTRSDSLIRIFETGPLPKMVATSHSGRLIAITHWGDNTVGFIDISADNPADWKHLPPVTIGNKLNLNYPLDVEVNRDRNSGFLLRGTVFTPDDRYLLVSGMAGPLQVVDISSMKHIGSINSLYGIRHLEVVNNHLYGSQNVNGTVLKVNLDSVVSAIERAKKRGGGIQGIALNTTVKTAKVGGGARTLCVSPDGRFIFVACNTASAIYVVDAENMDVVDKIRCDSYPVGLAISPDGHTLIASSQGRNHSGGNAVNIYHVERFGSDSTFLRSLNTDTPVAGDKILSDSPPVTQKPTSPPLSSPNHTPLSLWFALGLIAIVLLLLFIKFRKNRDDN